MTGKLKSRSISSGDRRFTIRERIHLQSSLDSCLGEELKDELGTPLNSLSTDAGELTDLGIRLSGLSSDSSLSWSEEYESEVNKKVQYELDKLDRIFKGDQNDPAMYDMEEISEWKHYFPNIYIVGCKTPTNSVDHSDASLPEDDEMQNCIQTQAIFPRNRSCVTIDQRHRNISHDVSNPLRHFNSLPRKLKSLEIEHYLQITSIRSSDTRQRTKNQRLTQDPKESIGELSPECTSLPFITTTPVKTFRKKIDGNKPAKSLILPPIDTAFRSISATPRKASSQSMYGRLTSNKELKAARLKSDLMTLFDNIPISNR